MNLLMCKTISVGINFLANSSTLLISSFFTSLASLINPNRSGLQYLDDDGVGFCQITFLPSLPHSIQSGQKNLGIYIHLRQHHRRFFVNIWFVGIISPLTNNFQRVSFCYLESKGFLLMSLINAQLYYLSKVIFCAGTCGLHTIFDGWQFFFSFNNGS